MLKPVSRSLAAKQKGYRLEYRLGDMDDSMAVAEVFFNLFKAFDTADNKVIAIGLKGVTL